MRAIILAAGRGTRLNPLTDDCPKCLLPLGNSKVLLDYQIEALRRVGIEDIVLVVGYCSERIRGYYGSSLRYVDNPDFLTTNSIYSLYMARRKLDTEILLFNCDILFHPDILRRILSSEYPNVVAVDTRIERLSGEMNVAFDHQGCISTISKGLNPLEAQAQSVQLVKFDAAGAQTVKLEVERLITLRKKNLFPTSSYDPLIKAGLLYAVDTGGLPWAEIDSHKDYERTAEHTLPLVEGF